MDLRAYYQQLREVETNIADEHVVVISKVTSDGGKAGVRTEVPRTTAARLIVEQRAKLATEDEAEAYRSELREIRARAEQAVAAAKMQVTVISEPELRALRERARAPKN